jgi:hypothetical protein
MKFISILLAAALAAACAFVFYRLAVPTEAAVRETTLAVLRSMPKAFLVLETERQVAVASVSDGGLLLGPRSGQATANRRTHYGVDVERIGPGDVEVDGSRVLVTLPDPAVFDTALDPASVRVLAKRSGIHALRDAATGKSIERELAQMLAEADPGLAGEDLQAQRQKFVDRLNRHAADTFKAHGLEVRFR